MNNKCWLNCTSTKNSNQIKTPLNSNSIWVFSSNDPNHTTDLRRLRTRIQSKLYTHMCVCVLLLACIYNKFGWFFVLVAADGENMSTKLFMHHIALAKKEHPNEICLPQNIRKLQKKNKKKSKWMEISLDCFTPIQFRIKMPMANWE